MMNEKYYVELDKLNKLLERKNKKTDFYNGIYDRYEYPVLTRIASRLIVNFYLEALSFD